MIKLITLDGREIALNAELIEKVESVPETVITLVSGKKLLVRQSMDEVISRVLAYRCQIGLVRPQTEREPTGVPDN